MRAASGVTGSFGEIGEVEAPETHVGTSRGTAARAAESTGTSRHSVFRVESELIEHLLFFRIAQNVVSLLHLLEAVLGGVVAGIQVRMMFARQAPVGLADLFHVGFAVDAKRLIIILLRHNLGPGASEATLASDPWPLLSSYFFSSTSTNSASTTLSLGFSEPPAPAPAAPAAPSPPGCPPPGPAVVLYIASANLWLAWVRL